MSNSKVLQRKMVTGLLRQLRAAGYTVIDDGIGFVASDDVLGEVFRALPMHEDRRCYLVRYMDGLITEGRV